MAKKHTEAAIPRVAKMIAKHEASAPAVATPAT
jgi:hypothetical protein